jgi:SM-20-related protein
VFSQREALAELTDAENLEKIADSLMARGWTVVDDIFGRVLTSALRGECQASIMHGQLRAAAVGSGKLRQVRTDVRGDQICWMDHPASSEPQRACLHRFEQLRLMLNRTLQLGLLDFECHFACYPAGARYVRHSDQFQGDGSRELSCVLYLNENWKREDGGQLRLYLDSGNTTPKDVVPRGGRLVMFMSRRFTHEVLPATRERLSIAGWFKTRAL